MDLRTERLLLRPFRATDFDAVHAYASDPGVCRWVDWGPNTPEETAVFLGLAIMSATEQPRRAHRLAVVRSEDDALIGAVDLHVSDPANRRGEMGYIIAGPAQRRGYATEAARALLTHGLGELGLHRITATCDPDNAGSAGVLRAIGMVQEGHLRHHFLIRGEWRDRLLFAAVAA